MIRVEKKQPPHPVQIEMNALSSISKTPSKQQSLAQSFGYQFGGVSAYGYTAARGAISLFRLSTLQASSWFSWLPMPLIILLALGRSTSTFYLSAATTMLGMQEIIFTSGSRAKAIIEVKRLLNLTDGNDGEAGRFYDDMHDCFTAPSPFNALEARDKQSKESQKKGTHKGYTSGPTEPPKEEKAALGAVKIVEGKDGLTYSDFPDHQLQSFCTITDEIRLHVLAACGNNVDNTKKLLRTLARVLHYIFLSEDNQDEKEKTIAAILEQEDILKEKNLLLTIKEKILEKKEKINLQHLAKTLYLDANLFNKSLEYINDRLGKLPEEIKNAYSQGNQQDKLDKLRKEEKELKKKKKALDELWKQKIMNDHDIITSRWETALRWVGFSLSWLSVAAYGMLTFNGGQVASHLLILPILKYIVAHSLLIKLGFLVSFLGGPIAPFVFAALITIFNLVVSYFFGSRQTIDAFKKLGRWIANKTLKLISETTWTDVVKNLLFIGMSISSSFLLLFSAKAFLIGICGASAATGFGLAVLLAVGCAIGTYNLLRSLWPRFKKILKEIKDGWKEAKLNNTKFTFILASIVAGIFTVALTAVAALADLLGFKHIFPNLTPAIFVGCFSACFNSIYNKNMWINLTNLITDKWSNFKTSFLSADGLGKVKYSAAIFAAVILAIVIPLTLVFSGPLIAKAFLAAVLVCVAIKLCIGIVNLFGKKPEPKNKDKSAKQTFFQKHHKAIIKTTIFAAVVTAIFFPIVLKAAIAAVVVLAFCLAVLWLGKKIWNACAKKKRESNPNEFEHSDILSKKTNAPKPNTQEFFAVLRNPHRLQPGLPPPVDYPNSEHLTSIIVAPK